MVVARAREMADPACLGQTLEVSATPEVLGPWLEAFPALALSVGPDRKPAWWLANGKQQNSSPGASSKQVSPAVH